VLPPIASPFPGCKADPERETSAVVRGRTAIRVLAAGLSLLLAGACASEEKQEPTPAPDQREELSQTESLVCKSSWRTVPSAEEVKKPLAVAAIAEDDVWVVGSTAGEGALRTGAQHWDGSRWSLFPTPNVGTGDNALNGVDGPASEDVWAVGYSERAKNYSTLVEHWDGDRWRVVESPNVGTSQYNTLTSVDALSNIDAWAVGSYRTATSRKTLIQRWDGTSWTIVSSPDPGTLSNSLLDVTAAGSGEIWAVGWKSSGEGLRSLVLHRDGTRWVEAAVPTVGAGDNVLTGVSAAGARDVWATGYYVDGTQYKTLTLHYDGKGWTRVPSSNGGDGISTLRGISAFSSTNAWAVGFEYRAAQDRYVASTQHWDGSTWTGVPSGISGRGRQDSEMFSVAKAPDSPRVWAVGQPANIESICGLRGRAAKGSVEETGASATDSKPASERSGSEGPPASDGPGLPVASRTSVRAADKAADAGISESTKTYGAVVADFDDDQLPDIFLGRHASPPRLYINDGDGHFTETNKGTFAQTDLHGCDAADVNGDGLEDIFCSTGAHHGTGAKRNHLYVQRPDHTFSDEAGQYGVLDPFGRARLSAFIDANGDPHPDLFVGNEANRGDGMPSPNRFFVNQGGSVYRPAPEYGLEREISAEFQAGASVGDLDKDGWEDLVMATPSGLRVYHNDEGKGFTDVAAAVGLGQSPEAVTLSDVNGDGWLDVIEVSSDELRVLLNDQGTFSSAFSTTLEYGSSVAAGDVNGDDRPDIYVMRGRDATGANAPDQVYLNNGDGTSFTRMSSIPSTSEGGAESVWPIDYDQNGLTDFLVLNGGTGGDGPVQLIAFFPAS
jgi:hypothetical protein